MYPNIDPICDRSHQADASLIHMFWTCPTLLSYWSKIFDTLCAVTGVNIVPSSTIALFVATSDVLLLSSGNRSFIAFVTLLARRLILLKWKSAIPPLHSHWVRDVLHFANLEKIRYLLRGSQQQFSRIWDPFFEYVRKLDFPQNFE